MGNEIIKIIKEEFTKKDIEEIVDKKLSMKQFKDTIEELIEKTIKNNKKVESNLKDISKEVLIKLYKTLWTKRSFWTETLK